MAGWSIDRPDPNVLIVRMQHTGAGWQQPFLLLSDAHWDNPLCDRDLLKRHLEEAKSIGAGIISIGDWYCAMQGKYDPRADKRSLRPEHQVANYLDALVDTSTDYLSPYRDNLIALTEGNHETGIAGRHETNILQRLASNLGCQAMGYTGFIIFRFEAHSKGQRSSRILYFDHGSGGDAPVTRGMIGATRRSVYTPDAHIVASGHIHQSWEGVISRQRCSDMGRPYVDDQIHIQLGTYKQEFTLGTNWHHITGKPPKPLGGAWVTFVASRPTGANYPVIKIRVERAI